MIRKFNAEALIDLLLKPDNFIQKISEECYVNERTK